MSQILLPQRFLAQPQYPAALDKGHWFGSKATFAITGAAPDFNAATGKSVSVAGVGSGSSIRVTEKGKSLYTPNGGWANIDVGQDWQGPNTIIALCRVNSIDGAWGGLFSKDSSSPSTQFAVGRFDSSNSLYGSVDNSTAVSFGGSTISSLVDFSVIAFTHSGVASTGMSYYRNGALVGTTSALGAQPSGTGVLGLGRSRDSSASFDSDVDWIAFIRAPIVVSAAQIKELSDNIWAVWKAPDRRIFVAAAGGTTDATGSSAGVATVSGVGASTAQSTGSGSGSSTASGAGASVAETTGSASGSSTVSGVGDFTLPGSSVGTASGTSSASGVTTSTAASSGAGNGVASVSGVGASTVSTEGVASGSATVSGAGDSIVPTVVSAVGTASGSSTVRGVSDEGDSLGGDDAILIYEEPKKKKRKPKKSLADIISDAIGAIAKEAEDIPGPTHKHSKIRELPQKEAVLVPALGPATIDPVEQFRAAEEEAQKVSALLAQYQEEVKRREFEEDEELLMLIAMEML